MASSTVNIFAALRTVTAQTQGMLESLEEENQKLETRVNSLMQEMAKLKQTHAVASEATAREITTLKNKNAELKSTAKKLEQSVAPLQQQVKELTEFKSGVAALLQAVSIRPVEQPVEQPTLEIVAINEKIAKDPNDPKLYLQKSNLLIKQKDYHGAESCFKQIEKLTTNINIKIFRQIQARNYISLNQLEKALETIQIAIKTDPTSGTNYYVEAEVYLAMGDKANAKISAEKAQKLGANIEKLNLN